MALVACQLDPTRRSLDTQVLACTENGRGAWEVVLADTVLYPEGGGQPPDHGTIAGVPITDVQTVADGRVVHTASAPVAVGPVTVEVDWQRRWDHTQQHTAQHLLTAIAQDRFGRATTSFHLYPQRCDVELGGEPLSDHELIALEDAVNQAILDGAPVRHRLVDVEAFAELDVRTRGLPDDFEGPVRLVEIAGLDTNTCGGTHVSDLTQIGVLALLGTERIRGGTRLYFNAGDRVRRALRVARARQARLTELLTCGPEEHAHAVARMQSAAKAGGRQRKAMLGELAGYLGAELGAQPGPVLSLHRVNGDMAFLNAVAGAAAAARGGEPALILLTAGGDRGPGVFLLTGPEAQVAALGPRVAAALEGRGGGRGGRFQGKAQAVEARDQALALLRG